MDLIKTQGWAFVDQELEIGLRAISAPIYSKGGIVKYAMTIVSPTNRSSKEEMIERFLGPMMEACKGISAIMMKQ